MERYSRWILRVKNDERMRNCESSRGECVEKNGKKKSYLFIQMSFCVVYKWKHEEVINHKARRFRCVKGELEMEGKSRWRRSDPGACFVNNFLSLSDKIIASKRIKRWKGGEKRKTTSIWTRRTWFFIWFCFHIFYPVSWFRIFVQWFRISKSFFSVSTSFSSPPCRTQHRRRQFLFCCRRNSKIPLCWACIKWSKENESEMHGRQSLRFLGFLYLLKGKVRALNF